MVSNGESLIIVDDHVYEWNIEWDIPSGVLKRGLLENPPAHGFARTDGTGAAEGSGMPSFCDGINKYK